MADPGQPPSLAFRDTVLESLFSSCQGLFIALDPGRHRSHNYVEAALETTLLGQRLNRWALAYLQVLPESTDQECEAIKTALEDIKQCLEVAKGTEDRYASTAPSSTGSRAIARVTEYLQDKASPASAHPNSSVDDQVCWVLRDVKSFGDTISHLEMTIARLEAIPNNILTEELTRARDAEALSLVQAAQAKSALDDPLPSQLIIILQHAAASVDPQLRRAIADRSHWYENIEVGEDVSVSTGHSAPPEQRPPGPGHTYQGVTIVGNANVVAGDNVGGKYLLDD